MEIEIIRKKNGKIDENTGKVQKLNVAAYARVSTDMEDQKSSFASQQSYYMEKIYKNPDWNFVEVYADEGISGTMTLKRDNFLRMINDALNGKINLILTKSISRFARNTLDTLTYVRKLREKKVAVIFEEEGINTMDMAGELLLTVLSSVAQQESENTSSRVRMGFKMKMERGELVGFNNCYGYVYDSKKKKMKIVKNEAEVVRLIFKSYIDGFGTTSIARNLTEMKVPSPTGKDKWGGTTISNILRNEKYVGDIVQGKTITENPLTHKRIQNKGQEDLFIYKDHHEPIIDRETFDKVQEILSIRNVSKETGRKMQHKFTFSGRFRCGFCGKAYVKKSLYKKNLAWDCLSVTGSARELCPNSKIMHEKTIKSCFMQLYFLLTSNDGLMLEEFLENLKSATKDRTAITMKENTEKDIATLRNKKNKILDLLIAGDIDDDSYSKKNEEIDQKLHALEIKKEQLNSIIKKEAKVELGIKKIKTELMVRDSSNMEKEFDEDIFEALVDYGIIGAINEKGEKDPYVIRFICKPGLNSSPRSDITDQRIVENNSLDTTKDSIYTTIIDFESNQHFFAFKKVNNRMRKTLIEKVRVRLEIEK